MKKFYVERIGLHITCWTYRNDERVMVSEETIADSIMKGEDCEVVYLPLENAKELHSAIMKAGNRLLAKKERAWIKNKRETGWIERKRIELGLN